MPELRRWTRVTDDEAEWFEDPAGEWVQIADVEGLEAELLDVREKLAAAERQRRHAIDAARDMAKGRPVGEIVLDQATENLAREHGEMQATLAEWQRCFGTTDPAKAKKDYEFAQFAARIRDRH